VRSQAAPLTAINPPPLHPLFVVMLWFELLRFFSLIFSLRGLSIGGWYSPLKQLRHISHRGGLSDVP